MYKTDSAIRTGWRNHFKTLAIPSNEGDCDPKYPTLVEEEIPVIKEMCKDSPATTISTELVTKAIKSLNKGKAADYFKVTAEHFTHGGTALIGATTEIVNSLFRFVKVTDALKIGALTPVFMYRGKKLSMHNCSSSHHKDTRVCLERSHTTPG